ncbi:MAG: hypothetical protein K9G81_04500 [Rhodobacteraceae bacterium]|nr:hypothetical protein [Paracoccaceae bacterium]
MMNLQRKLTLMVATGAVALGAGHFVQKQANSRMAEGNPPAGVVISSVTPVAAGPEAIASQTPTFLPPLMDETPTEATAEAEMVESPPSAKLAMTEDATEPDEAAIAAHATAVAINDCAMQLDLLAQPGAMIGLTLLAPCSSDQRVVLRHAGLAVTGKTSASGALFAVLPALAAVAEVEVLFPSGDTAKATIDVPAIADMQRFVVQWQAEDAFQLHGFENGASYGQPGHVSASYAGSPGEGAFLTLLGDSTTDLPLLAEVFTFGADKDAQIVLESAVTEATCGREILGETIMAGQGSVEITDLSLAMPDCTAIGDILVLKNLVQDMKLAAAN